VDTSLTVFRFMFCYWPQLQTDHNYLAKLSLYRFTRCENWPVRKWYHNPCMIRKVGAWLPYNRVSYNSVVRCSVCTGPVPGPAARRFSVAAPRLWNSLPLCTMAQYKFIDWLVGRLWFNIASVRSREIFAPDSVHV